MTFEAQIEALTGLDLTASSSYVNHDETSQILKDGVLDVTNRWLSLRSQDAHLFTRSTSESTSNGGLGAGFNRIISVVRESGTDSDWRAARKVSIDLQSRLTDVNSIHYASKYSPAFVIGGDGAALVYPAPSAGGANSYKIYYVNETPVNSSDAALVYSHSDLNYFPTSHVYMVVVYSCIKILETFAGQAHDNIPSNLNIISVAPSLPSISDNSFTFTETAPNYISPVISPNFSDADSWINTEEDPEMSSARVQVIQSEIGKYQAEIQNSLNLFNKENAEYQINFNKEVQNAQINSKDDDQKIQKYSAEIQKYASDVNKEVQEFQGNVQKVKLDAELFMVRAAKFQKQYDDAFMMLAPKQQQQQQPQGRRRR